MSTRADSEGMHNAHSSKTLIIFSLTTMLPYFNILEPTHSSDSPRPLFPCSLSLTYEIPEKHNFLSCFHIIL